MVMHGCFVLPWQLPQKNGGHFFLALVYALKNIQSEGSVDDLSGWRKNWNVGVGDLIDA